MEHRQIERDNLIDRYVRGTMALPERRTFEEHFLDCPECLEQLETARSLRQALRVSAAENTSVDDRPVVARSRWPVVWQWVAAGAAACLLVAAVTSVALFQQLQLAHVELASARSVFEQRSEDARRALEREPVVYTLAMSRGARQGSEIALPRDRRWMVFSIELDTTQVRSYRASVVSSIGGEVWHDDHVQPASPDALAVSVPSNVFVPGTYTLTIEAAATAGRFPLARFPLRMGPPK